MASGTTEKMKVKVTIDPFKELDKDEEKWITESKELKKTIKDIEYTDTVELNPNKWPEKKLNDALQALVRYELKIFAVRFNKIFKRANKGGVSDKEKGKIDDELLDAYNELVKDVKSKISDALDEVAGDKGDNKQGLRDGKIALQKLNGVDLVKVFADPRNGVVKAFEALAKALGKAGKDEKAKEAAFKTAETVIVQERKEFDGSCKDAEAALKYLIKTGEMIGKKDADDPLKKFAAAIDSNATEFKKFSDALASFDEKLNDVSGEVKSRSLDEDGATRNAKEIGSYSNFDNTGRAVDTALKEMTKLFKEALKDLK